MPDVVGVEEGNEAAGGRRDPRVSSGRGAAILLMPDHLQAGDTGTTHDFRGLVGGPIVDHETSKSRNVCAATLSSARPMTWA